MQSTAFQEGTALRLQPSADGVLQITAALLARPMKSSGNVNSWRSTMLISRVLTLTCLLVLSVASAQACPSGTVFSHFGENCHYKGQGNSVAVKCNVRSGGSCPAGFAARRSDETKRNLCCPTQTRYSPPAKCIQAVRKSGPGGSVKIHCLKWASLTLDTPAQSSAHASPQE
jgi:hypothetical protein